MKKRIIPFLMLLTFLTACGSQNTDEDTGTTPSQMKETGEMLSDALSDVLSSESASGGPSEYDFAPRGFTTPEGIPSHQFYGIETADLKARASLDGQYLLLITLQGDETAQVQVSSDGLDLHNESVPVTSPGEYGVRKLQDLTAGEYTFTAESLNETESDLLALLCPVQKLDTLPDSLEGSYPYTYLCTFPEDTALNYTFQDMRDSSGNATYGTMVRFYSTADEKWMETIYMEEGSSETSGSIQIPAGDIIINFHSSNWRITFE